MDYLINLWLCRRLVLGRNKHHNDIENRIKLLQDLAINEMIEIIAPLSYLVCLVIAYYGPNAELIGGVKSNHWQYSSLNDISQIVKNITIFFVADLSSGLLCHCILWKLCKISLIRACLALQKEFGLIFALRLINDITTVRSEVLFILKKTIKPKNNAIYC